MINTDLKETIERFLPQVQKPGQYTGGEIGSVVKDHRQVRGRLCLSFADCYTLGMSHHGLQVLYSLMNNDPQWACERAFTPWIDFEEQLRRRRLPLYSLETFTRLADFDVVGFSLQSTWAAFRFMARTARRRIRWSLPAARERRIPKCWPRSSTSSSSATARKACPGSWTGG